MISPLNNLLKSVPEEVKSLCNCKLRYLFGNCIDFPSSDFVWEDLRRYSIVLLGIGCANDELYLNNIRKSFYNLYLHSEFLKIIDLGNILVDDEDIPKIEDVLKSALKYNTFIIPFGKSPIYLNYYYEALKSIDDSISITYITKSASVGDAIDNISEQNHLAHLLGELNKQLFSLNIVAYQLYETNPESLELFNRYYCQMMRLGALRSDFKSVEPILRDTDLLGINISAIRQSDAPAASQGSPNGLYAEEACQLARYAGISDRLVLAGICGFNGAKDDENITSQLIAQIIWHLIDGYVSRKDDNPLKNVNGVKKYIVDMGTPMRQLVFYYSELSERWWMEVPADSSLSSLLVACSHDDYRVACNHEVPLRWVWFHQKTLQNGKSD